jgi:hypothetical protein
MIRVSVSNLDLYRAFRDDDEFELGVFLAQLRGEMPRTPAMERGGAFAKAMEHANLGEQSTISADGHTFAFTCDAEIEAWPCREEKREKDYGGVIVTARCDRIMGRMIADDKTTSQFDAEKYFGKMQHCFYLDIFEADVFKWHIWSCREIGHCEWEVYAHDLLTQYRYPDLEEDCARLAHDFKDFMERLGYNEGVRRVNAGQAQSL